MNMKKTLGWVRSRSFAPLLASSKGRFVSNYMTNHSKNNVINIGSFSNLSNIKVVKGIERPMTMQSKRMVTTSQASNHGTTSNSSDESSAVIRDRLLRASMLNVPAYGFTEEALTKGANDIGLSPFSIGLLENGVADLVYHFLQEKRINVNAEMEKHIEEIRNAKLKEEQDQSNKDSSDGNAGGSGGDHTSESAQKAVLLRLVGLHVDALSPYVGQWPDAVAQLVKPRLVWNNLQVSMAVVEDMARYLDLRSSRMDWYLERSLLTYLYSTTELYLLTDQSLNSMDTKDFLERNIDGYLKLRSLLIKNQYCGGQSSGSYGDSGNMNGSSASSFVMSLVSSFMHKDSAGVNFGGIFNNLTNNPIFTLMKSFVGGSGNNSSSEFYNENKDKYSNSTYNSQSSSSNNSHSSSNNDDSSKNNSNSNSNSNNNSESNSGDNIGTKDIKC